MRILGVPLDIMALPRQLLGKSEASTEPAPAAAATTPAAAPPSDRALRQLMTQYNVRQITPRQFSELVQQLSRDQALPANELAALHQLRSQLDATEAPPDVTLDLMQFAHDQLELSSLDALPGKDLDGSVHQGNNRFALAAQQVELLSRFNQWHQTANATPLEALA
jgi:hypothetical protein